MTIEERATLFGLSSTKNVDEDLRPLAITQMHGVYVHIATEQEQITRKEMIENAKRWAIEKSFIPFDYYNDTEGVEEDRVVSFSDLMDYLKVMEE